MVTNLTHLLCSVRIFLVSAIKSFILDALALLHDRIRASPRGARSSSGFSFEARATEGGSAAEGGRESEAREIAPALESSEEAFWFQGAR
jgi:hypothetical protein